MYLDLRIEPVPTVSWGDVCLGFWHKWSMDTKWEGLSVRCCLVIRSGKDYDVTFFAWERWTTRDCKVFNSRYPILFHVFFWLGLRFPFKITQFINLQYNDIDSWLEHASFEDVLTENGDLFISMLRLPHISINLVEKKNYQSFEKAQTKRNSTRDYDRLNYQPAIWNWLPCLNRTHRKISWLV